MQGLRYQNSNRIFTSRILQGPPWKDLSPTAFQHIKDTQNHLSRFYFFVGTALIYASAIQPSGPDNQTSFLNVDRFSELDEFGVDIVGKISDYADLIFSPITVRTFLFTGCKAELVRKTQMDLIKVSLECCILEIKTYLMDYTAAIGGGLEVPDGRLYLRSGSLLDFVFNLRSESVESRIWRHLQSED